MDLIRAVRPKAERVFYVSPNFHDNYQAHEFSTIQTAIDYIHDSSWYSDLSVRNVAVIYVYPGEYTNTYETGLRCWPYIQLKTMGSHNFPRHQTAVIKATGVWPYYTLAEGADYEFHIMGFTIRTDTSDGRFSNLLHKARFQNCHFDKGSFLNNIWNYDCSMTFNNCTGWCDKFFEVTQGDRGTASHGIVMNNCDIYPNNNDYVNMKIDTTGDAGTSAYIEFNNCSIVGRYKITGDWNIKSKNTLTRRSHTDCPRNEFDTTGEIIVINSVIGNGLHFSKDTSADKVIHNCDFNDHDSIAIVGADITADTIITIVDYIGNIQQNGNCGEIQIIDPIKPVGANAINRYMGIQCAVDSVVTTGVIQLNESYTDLAELEIPTDTNITIDGGKIYSLTFTGDIVELGTGENLIFYGLSTLNGNNIEITGNNAYIGFEETLTANCYITLTSGTGTYCLVYSSTVKGITGHPAITHDNVDSTIILGYSRIDGGVGHPAILFTANATSDDKFKCKFSTLIHGDGVANKPIQYTGAGSINISVYSSALNAAWDPSDFFNTIGSANNTTDNNINF